MDKITEILNSFGSQPGLRPLLIVAAALVTVPNAVIANAQIVNPTGGPHDKMRVRVQGSVAYGSDLARREEVPMSCVQGIDHVCSEPAPRVRFRPFGASGLDHELLAWIDRPVYRGRALHALDTRVYDGLNAAGIEIPFNELDVYVKQQVAPKLA